MPEDHRTQYPIPGFEPAKDIKRLRQYFQQEYGWTNENARRIAWHIMWRVIAPMTAFAFLAAKEGWLE